MDKPIRFINHQGREILLVDVSNQPASDVEKIVRRVPEFVTGRPAASLLLLTDFTGASFDTEAIRTMKESAVFDKPYIKKSAWIGTQSLPSGLYEEIKGFSRRDLPAFKTREAALNWLSKD